MSRFRDALFIQEGAVNPTAVTHALTRAIEEQRKENTDTDATRNGTIRPSG